MHTRAHEYEHLTTAAVRVERSDRDDWLQTLPLKPEVLEMGLENGRYLNLGAYITFSDKLTLGTEDHKLRIQELVWHCTRCGYI